MGNLSREWNSRRRFVLLWLWSSALAAASLTGLFVYLWKKGLVSQERADLSLTISVLAVGAGTLITVFKNWRCPSCEGLVTSAWELLRAWYLPRPGRCWGCRTPLN